MLKHIIYILQVNGFVVLVFSKNMTFTLEKKLTLKAIQGPNRAARKLEPTQQEKHMRPGTSPDVEPRINRRMLS